MFQKGERENRKETIIKLKIKDNFPVPKRFQTEKAHWVGMEGNKIKTHSHNFKIPEDYRVNILKVSTKRSINKIGHL